MQLFSPLISIILNNHDTTSYWPNSISFGFSDIASSGTDVLQGMFVFPNTRGIYTGDYSMFNSGCSNSCYFLNTRQRCHSYIFFFFYRR